MIEHAVPEVRFAVAKLGYNRDQVDADVARCERHASQTRRRIVQAQTALAKARRQIDALEARAAQLQERADHQSARVIAPVAELTDQLLQGVHELSRDVPAKVQSDAETESAEIAKRAAEIVQVARERAASIVDAAQHVRERAAQLVDQARSHRDDLVNEAKAIIDEQYRIVTDQARAGSPARLQDQSVESRHQAFPGRREAQRMLLEWPSASRSSP